MCSPQKQSLKNALQNGLKDLQLFKKETPTQMFSCEICKMFKKTFFTKHLWWLFLSQKQIKRNKNILLYHGLTLRIFLLKHNDCKIWQECSLIMKYYNSQVMKKPSWKNVVQVQ